MTERCGDPHPTQPIIQCDYERGHRPLDAIGGNRPPTIYAHGNAATNLFWGEQLKPTTQPEETP